MGEVEKSNTVHSSYAYQLNVLRNVDTQSASDGYGSLSLNDRMVI